jgi:putative ATP-dependent endonuclease of OLD family
MRIRRLSIRNYRGIGELEVTLPQHALLVGQNNVGKSAVLEALALLLGRDSMRPQLTDYDFHNKRILDDNGRSVPIVIRGVLTDFDNGAATGPETRLFAGLMDAGALQSWDVETEELRPDAADGNGKLPAVEVAFHARYNQDLGEFETMRTFWNPDLDPFADAAPRLGTKHLAAAGLFTLPASRLWQHALGFSSSTLQKLLREFDAKPGEQIRSIANDLAQLEHKASDADELRSLLNEMLRVLGEFMPLQEPERTAGYEVTGLDMASVERALVFFLQTAGSEQRLPAYQHGTGLVSLQVLLMLLMFGKYRIDRQRTFILAAEEPELHLYPHAQRRIVDELRQRTTQSIVTTHSPALAEQYEPDEVLLLRHDAGGKRKVSRLWRGVPAESEKNGVKRIFYEQRAQIADALMGNVCLLVEGVSEALMLPLLSRIVPHCSFDTHGISCIDGKGSEIHQRYEQLRGLLPATAVLVDGDADGDGYREEFEGDDEADAVVLQWANGLAFEDCLVEGITASVEKALWDRVKGTGFAKGEKTLLADLKACKGNIAVARAAASAMREAAWVSTRIRNLIVAVVAISQGKEPDATPGVVRDGDSWRIKDEV